MDVSEVCCPLITQEEVSPIKKGDYKGDVGLIRCGVCGRAETIKDQHLRIFKN